MELVTTAVGVAALAALAYPTVVAVRSDRPSAGAFAVLLGAVSVWAVCRIVPAFPLPPTVTTVTAWKVGANLGGLGVPIAWFAYARRYTGRDGRTRAVTWLAAFAAATAVFVGLGDDAGPLVAIGVLTGAVAGLGGTAVASYGGVLIFRAARSHARVTTRQSLLVAAVVLSPYLVSPVVTVVLGSYTVSPTVGGGVNSSFGASVGFLASGLSAAVAVRQHPTLASFPRADAVARATVVRDLREPVVVLDHDDRLLDVNDSAARTFDWEPDAVAGRSASAVEPPLSVAAAGETGTVRLPTTEGRRRFQYSVSPVGGENEPIARAVVLRDVTDRRTREQRLSVLNRVLRHNIRNDLDVVLAYAAEIEDPEIRARITEAAEGLVSLGTKARRAERAMAATADDSTAVDAAVLAREVAADHEDRAGTLSVDAPETLRVHTHGPALRAALGELVNNAVVHGGESPAVELRVDRTVDGVRFAVADDGPGISAHDRAVLDRDRETQLDHTTGIGLWLVEWIVTRLGGEVTVADRDPTGTLATVRLVVDRSTDGESSAHADPD